MNELQNVNYLLNECINFGNVKIELPKSCNGCFSSTSCLAYINFFTRISSYKYILDKMSKCSCRNCLVKTICDDPCDNYSTLSKKIGEIT